MKIKINLNVLAIVIMAVVVIVLTISIIMAKTTYSAASKDIIYSVAPEKINIANKLTRDLVDPAVDKNNKIADAHKFLLLISVTQNVLENTIKANNDISFMAVYLDDGTIIAHIKPERIGKNMFDVDIEFSNYAQDIFDAINNKKIFKGVEYDPLLNEYIKFMVKPIHISSLNQDLSLLIGINESSKKEVGSITMSQ